MEWTFFLALLAALKLLFWWAFRTLPREGWQILAAVPLHKTDSQNWSGLNLTYYGLFSANAYMLATVIYFILISAMGIPLKASFMFILFMFLFCIPSSRILAGLIEKKRNTFTVGGAACVGILMAPFIITMVNLTPDTGLTSPIPVIPVMAIISVAYAFGEGTGRLACISFGCCYGRPIADLDPRIRRFAERFAFIFSGKTKKIAYEAGLDGRQVIPVQAMTAVIFTAAGFLGMFLFLRGAAGIAFILVLVVTQGWRFASEMLRADYRGGGRITVYQIMTAIAVLYALAIMLVFGAEPYRADLGNGIRTLWDPAVILGLQGFWLCLFLYTGRSRVTGSTMTFHVRNDMV
jgi:hypothetical protein